MEPCVNTESFSRLAEVYRCVQTASKPRGSPADVARWMFPQVRGSGSAEMTRIGLTVVGKIASSVTAQSSLTPEVAAYFTELLKVLLDDMSLMSHLVSFFEDEDQILSHLAAKSASACVLHLLLQSGTVCPVWSQKCLQAFGSAAPGHGLDACLWSLTEVFKRLLKGAHGELFGKLLRALDSSLSALCLRYFPAEETAHCTDPPENRQWGSTLCLLMDLMEVLTASSTTSGTCFCLASQKVTYVHSAALLRASSRSTGSFVTRRALHLLKRAALQRAAEDWSLGGALATEPSHEHLGADLRRLSHTVLTALRAGWLESVQVGGASFFGGTEPAGDKFQRPDCVTLRAVSLLVLKSMELRIQSAGGAGLDSAADVQGDFQSLWGFLQRNSGPLNEATHLCCWVGLLFGEQDDDMMEAAKALLAVFLHQRRRPGWDAAAALEAACGYGYNPHCNFLALLQSISFDHSILLDFLISAETCFLEYFVRYLRFLRSDPEGFAAACRRVDSAAAGCCFPKQSGDSCEDVPAADPDSSAAGLRLVEYSSSEESDQDAADSQAGPGTSLCEEMRSSSENVKQPRRCSAGRSHAESPYLVRMQSSTKTTAGRRPGGLPLGGSGGGRTSGPFPPTHKSKHPDSQTSVRAAGCLLQLREVVSRLQAKKLFPYNPSSLLKLLTPVGSCSHSPSSHSIKE